MRTIVTLALMLMMLTAVGVAAAKLASVTDYPPPSGLTPEYMSHLVALNEAYDGDLLTLSVNDLVFDGTTVDVAMNVQPTGGQAGLYGHAGDGGMRRADVRSGN